MNGNNAAAISTTIVKCPELLATDIKVNPDTDDPTKAWDKLKNKIKCEKIVSQLLPLDTPIYDNKVRFVCISDTHSRTNQMKYEIPAGDVLIHAGDFTKVGLLDEVEKFSAFLGSLDNKFKYKVVIAGNHELTFDPDANQVLKAINPLLKENKYEVDPRSLLKNCIYLEESTCELFGIKIYGSPYQPRFGDWAFNVNRGADILKHWNRIPNEVDVLITHGPPLGFGDRVRSGEKVGCAELLTTIRQRVRPKYHIFGHIHEDPGVWRDDLDIIYINASTCNLRYEASNPPILFDIELPACQTKLNK